LHIYGVEQEHGDAIIVGDRESLTELRDAITMALEGLAAQQITPFVNDGEAYDVYVALAPEVDQGFPSPYVDSWCTEQDSIKFAELWDWVREGLDKAK
jgi:hypothetical protein